MDSPRRMPESTAPRSTVSADESLTRGAAAFAAPDPNEVLEPDPDEENR
jgi:hypothetical protein